MLAQAIKAANKITLSCNAATEHPNTDSTGKCYLSKVKAMASASKIAANYKIMSMDQGIYLN